MGKESQTFYGRSSALARRKKGVMPVIDEVDAMLYEGKDVRQAVQDLTARESKAEH